MRGVEGGASESAGFATHEEDRLTLLVVHVEKRLLVEEGRLTCTNGWEDEKVGRGIAGVATRSARIVPIKHNDADNVDLVDS